MAFENVDQDPEDGNPTPTGTSPNRTFLYVAGGLGGLVLLTLICMAVYTLVVKPRMDTNKQSQQATGTAASIAQAQKNQVATEVEKTSRAAAEKITSTATPKAVLPTATSITLTQTVIIPTDAAVTATLNPLTATSVAKTSAALQLTLTAAHQTGTPGTPVVTSLPTTGFFEDSGSVPMLIGAAFLLILVIFLARRLRTAS